MTPSITIIHPAALRTHPAPGNCRWIYADSDTAVCRWVESLLPRSAVRLVTPREFNDAVAGMRDKYVAWIDAYLERRPDEEYLFTPLYRNPSTNDMILHAAWLGILRDRIEALDAPLLIITRSAGFAEVVAALVGKQECRIEGGAYFSRTRAVRRARNLARLLRDAARFCWRMAVCRTVLGESHAQRVRGTAVLVDTYLHDTDIGPDGRFSDRYFPGLLAFFERNAIAAAIYPFFFDIAIPRAMKMIRGIKASSTLFAPPELFLRFSDLFDALRQCLASALHREPIGLPFSGIDMTPLIAENRFKAGCDALGPALLLRAPMRLAESGIRPRMLLDWHENQTLDKANALGFGRHLPETRVVAFKQLIPMRNWLCFYSTDAEVRRGIAPSINLVGGRKCLEEFRRFDTTGQYRLVPQLRYAYMHAQSLPENKNEENTLLVLLTHVRSESIEILRSIVAILPTAGNLFSRIVVKPHPDIGLERFRAWAREDMPVTDSFDWSTEKLGVQLERCRVAVSQASSSLLEAICFGVPVVIMGSPAGLDLNHVEPCDARLWRTVYAPSELEAALKAWSPAHPVPWLERRRLALETRADFFEPVTDETMQEFLLVHGARKAPAHGEPVEP